MGGITGIGEVPKKVSWIERDGKTKFEGTVIQEVQDVANFTYGDFCKVIQVIRREGHPEEIIRCGYYTKKHNAPDRAYRWASRRAFVLSRSAFKKLLDDLNI